MFINFLTLIDTATTELKGDYSGDPARACIVASGNKTIYITQLRIAVADTDTDYNKFGNLSALSNGLKLRIEQRENDQFTTAENLLNGQGLTNNLDLGAVGTLEIINDGADPTATRQVVCDIKFTQPLRLASTDNIEQMLTLYLSDDLSALESLRASVFWNYTGY